MTEAEAVVLVEISTLKINSPATISHDAQTCRDENVGGNTDSCQQQRSRHAGPPSNNLEEQVDHDLGWDLNGRKDKVCEEHVQAEPGDVQADPVVCSGNSKPAQSRKGGRSREVKQV